MPQVLVVSNPQPKTPIFYLITYMSVVQLLCHFSHNIVRYLNAVCDFGCELRDLPYFLRRSIDGIHNFIIHVHVF